MDAYFVRVYTLRDGSKVTAPGMYALYEQAEADLGLFCPEAGVVDLSEVSYVTIEKRFSPTPIWHIEGSEAR